jgi:hypothetical protein
MPNKEEEKSIEMRYRPKVRALQELEDGVVA